MKKGNVIALFILGLFMISLLAGIVSAALPTASDAGTAGTITLTTVINFLINDWGSLATSSVNAQLFTRFAILLLFFLFVSGILADLPLFANRKWMGWLSSAVIVIVGTKFIPTSFLISLFLPSSALILAFSLVIQIFFVYEINVKVFKNSYFFSWMMWSLWGVFLIGLVVYYSDLLSIRSMLGITAPTIELSSAAVWTYIAAAALAWIGFWSKVQLWIARKTLNSDLKDRLTNTQIAAAYQMSRRIETLGEQIDAMAGSDQAVTVSARQRLIREKEQLERQFKADYLK